MSVRLVTSQRTEALVDALAEAIDARRVLVGPLEPTHVIVPSANLERHLVLALAERRGIAANLRFHRLQRFVGRWIARERIDVARVIDRRALEAFVLAALLDDRFLATSAASPLARYVGDGDEDSVARDRRRVQLALRLARLLEGYAYSRPEMLRAWERSDWERDGGRRVAEVAGDGDRRDGIAASDAMERWQRALWCEVHARASSRGVVPLHDALARLEGRTPTPGALPATLHVVGLSYVARIFQWVFGAMGARTDLSLYVLNPCREFWEDVAAESELRARLEEPTEVLDREDDPPLLTWWGRPGREHVHLLGELTGGDREERFDLPEKASSTRDSLLARVQDDVLERRAFPDARLPADGTIEAFACPGVRREVEAVAEEIWRLVRASRADAPLRFHEIAVLVHADDRDTYLPHVAAVFGQARRIPHHVVDLSLQSESRVVEAASLLVDVLLSRFSRPEVLALLRHPALRVPGASAELDRAAWARIVDRLGVFHGRDGGDLAGTYLAPETLGVDAVSWSQAASRLALGAFLECETDLRPFESATGPIHPEPGEADEATPLLALLVRSLIADARFAETAELPLSAWAVFFEALFSAYLEARGDREESELRRCLGACRAVAEREVGANFVGEDGAASANASADGSVRSLAEAASSSSANRVARVRVHVAAELLREGLASLGGARGEYLADGVVVSALAPMRAIPFRVVFVLGMGEGRFPTSERRDPLDLRAQRRRLGDVTPAERDKYVFLETLLCARERFVVSWVARDELTGEAIAPSPVVVQLLELLQRRYVTEGELVRSFPLRRHDEPREQRAIREATLESLAYRAGDALHHAAGRAVSLDEVRAHGGPLAELLVVHERLDAPAGPPAARDVEPSAVGDRAPRAIDAGDDELVVSLAALRRFLVSPLRGWATAVLRLEREDDDEARAALEDEPFRPSPLERADALREAFEEGLRRRMKPEEWHEREGVPLRQAHGRWPLGTVAERGADADRRMLGGWRRLFSQTVARAGMTPRRVRFGASVEVGESDVVRDPIALPNARVVGRTSLLFEDERASLVLLAKEPPQGAELRRERLRHALDGFVDYVALVAGGAGPRDSHRALVLYGGDAAVDASTRFGPLEPDEARRWLVERARELRGEPHDVFLPFESIARVLTSAEGWRGLTRGSLTREIEAERRRRRNAPESWRAGLVRDEHTLRVPDEVDVVVRRRFGLFVRLAGLDVGGGS